MENNSKKSYGEAVLKLIKLKREKLELERKKERLEAERDKINAQLNKS